MEVTPSHSFLASFFVSWGCVLAWAASLAEKKLSITQSFEFDFEFDSFEFEQAKLLYSGYQRSYTPKLIRLLND